jgi:hypothetical protein
MAPPILLYGSKTWMIKTKDINRVQATGMKYLRSVTGCTRMYHVRNGVIRRDLHTDSVHQTATLKKKQTSPLGMMPDDSIP